MSSSQTITSVPCKEITINKTHLNEIPLFVRDVLASGRSTRGHRAVVLPMFWVNDERVLGLCDVMHYFALLANHDV